MSDFSDRPFVAGSLIGLRAFGVDDLGRLVGPAYGGVFKPGENEAACRTTFGPRRRWLFNPAQYGWTAPTTTLTFAAVGHVAAEAKEEEEEEPEVDETSLVEHTTGGLDCTCGYYAYFDGCNDYGELDRVSAVVEGYGVCTVGNRGFRASKARLVALVLPERKSSDHARWDRWSDWQYSRKGITASFVPVTAMAAVWSLAIAISLAVGGDLLGLLLLLPALILGWAVRAGMRGWTHGLHRHYSSIHPELECVSPAASLDVELVRRNYPDVPVYGSVKAALAAHPLTPPEPDPLPTPDDEDFWTREATR